MQEINENTIVNQEQLIGSIDKILIKRSIARRCSEYQPLKAPVGIVVGAQYDKVSDKLEIKRSDVVALTEKIRTEFTIEALQDLQMIHGESFHDVLAHYLVDALIYKIDEKFITMIKDRARTSNPLVFDGATYDRYLSSVGQSISVNVMKGLCDLPISDNRSQNGFCIVSSNIASILALTTPLGDNINTNNAEDDSPSYLGNLAGVEYFIDYTHPNDGIDSCVYGILGNGISKGSTIFSPYTREWLDAVNSDSGENAFFLLDRTAMSINPLDQKYYNEGAGESAFIGKFDVDVLDLQLFN